MLLAADNLSAARPRVRRALENRDGRFIAGLCRRVQDAGAHWLDLNPGFLPPNRRGETWRFLVETAEAACDLKLMLDAPQPESLALALEFCTRPPVLNMATAEPERLEAVLDLARAHGLEMVAAAMTDAVPLGADERLGLAAFIVDRAARKGISGDRLILDPMVMPLALPRGEQHARGVIGCLRAVPTLFDPAPLTLIGLSNLTTATAGARAHFAAAPFLAAAWGAGLDIVLCDVMDESLQRVIGLCRVWEGEKIFAPAEFSD